MRNSCVLSLTVVLVLAVLLSVLSCIDVLASGPAFEDRGKNIEAAGALVAKSQTGKQIQFPLKQTTVHAEISGSISRVTVEQRFENPFAEKIEAVYLFPLPQAAAVDAMTITVGGRRIKGVIMKRQEAKATYEAAKNSGRTAALLDQLRPNVFSQSVANILPGDSVTVSLTYVETLRYEEGSYEFVFPMRIGERYTPASDASAESEQAGESARTQADDVVQPVMQSDEPSGHEISLELNINAGLPIQNVTSTTHKIEVDKAADRAVVRLATDDKIPNRDFVLKYSVAAELIQDGSLVHHDSRGGFFSIILQPPVRATFSDITPRELVFVLDTSGSMSGFPIENAKKTISLALSHLNPQDTFNLITFAGATSILFNEPVPATRANLRKAKEFLDSQSDGGGTEMMKAIRASLEPTDAQDHIRIVCFLTDGQVGNDTEILAEVQKHPKARIFSMGFGSDANRYLLDKMAEFGRGEVDYVTNSETDGKAAERFFKRVREPLLTDITVDWNGLPVSEVFPSRIPDLFSAKPVILTGRYSQPASGVIRLRGMMSGRWVDREITLNLSGDAPENEALASLWARQKVDSLTTLDMAGLARGDMKNELREQIEDLGLTFRLMTPFTSFVAVDDMVTSGTEAPTRVDVPAEASVDYPGGLTENVQVSASYSAPLSMSSVSIVSTASVSNLPINGRSLTDLALLVPGILPVPGYNSLRSSLGPMSVSGNRPGSNSFVLDGVNANLGGDLTQNPGAAAAGLTAPGTAAGSASGVIPQASVQEAAVTSFNGSAEYGRNSGGIVSVITKSGTNEFHGEVFGRLGNDALNAGDWFANSKGTRTPAGHTGIWGGAVGGPVKRDSIFFFVSYEGQRSRNPGFAFSEVPDLAARAASPPLVKEWLNSFPLPNGRQLPDGLAEFSGGYVNRESSDAGVLRLDARLSDNAMLSGRYNFSRSSALERGNDGLSLNTVSRSKAMLNFISGSLDYTFSPNVVGTLRANISGLSQNTSAAPDSFGGASINVALNRAGASHLIGFTGQNATLGLLADVHSRQRQILLSGSTTIVSGNHTVKVGGDFRRLSPTLGLRQKELNVLFYTIEDALNNQVSREILYSRADHSEPVFNYLSAFAQDDWRVTPKLSLKYGLRWDLNLAPSAGAGALPAKVTSSASGVSVEPSRGDKRLWRTTFLNLAPNIAATYQLWDRSGREGVVRGGLSVIYDAGNEAAANAFTASYPSTKAHVSFNEPLAVYENINFVDNSDVGPYLAVDPHYKLPLVLEWNAGFEQQLGSSNLLSLMYVGSSGNRLALTRTIIDATSQFDFVRLTDNSGHSRYNSLQLSFNRRFTNRFSAMVSYTLSRSVDNVSIDSTDRSFMLSGDAVTDRGLSDFDTRHVFSGMFVFRPPQFYKKGFLGILNRDWQLSSVVYGRSAMPVNVIYTVPTKFGYAFLRPDPVPGVPQMLRSPSTGIQTLNAEAFSVPANGTQGLLNRNSLRGNSFFQANLALQRSIKFSDSISLEFEIQALNVFNHPNFSDPVGNDVSLGMLVPGTGTFVPNGRFGESASMYGRSLWSRGGLLSGAGNSQGGPRAIQFGLRFLF